MSGTGKDRPAEKCHQALVPTSSWDAAKLLDQGPRPAPAHRASYVAPLVGIVIAVLTTTATAYARTWGPPAGGLPHRSGLTCSTSAGNGGSGMGRDAGGDMDTAFDTIYSATKAKYVVSTIPIATSGDCRANTFRVTLLGVGDVALAERSGTLDADGKALPDFSASDISADAVLGVSSVITGTSR